MASTSAADDQRAGEICLDRQVSLYLRCNTPKGRGVFASQPIPAGSILEISPVLVLSPEENAAHIAKTELFHYTYNWPIATSAAAATSNPTAPQPAQAFAKTQAIILGLGSMFNHSARAQNVGWTRDLERQVVVYRALRDIAKDEELCISYGDRLTFVDADAGDNASEDDEDVDHDDVNGRMSAHSDPDGFLGRIGLGIDE